MFDSFGNKVKIKSSPQTEEKGLAGKIGVVHGQTTPSLKEFEIIGTPTEDFALNVYFDDLKIDYWFDADLLENLDEGQGTVIRLHGIDKKWTKGQNGEWMEEGDDSQKKKWWEFWK